MVVTADCFDFSCKACFIQSVFAPGDGVMLARTRSLMLSFARHLSSGRFSHQLCDNLERKRMIWKASAGSVWNMPRHGHNEQEALERMARNGLVTRDPTERQTSREHRSVGSAIKANCFICRKYLKRDGTVDYKNTSWQCKECRMPLCKLPHIDKQIGWTETCLTEHQESDHPIIGCTGSYSPSITFPKD
jgi:hypothetical protein